MSRPGALAAALALAALLAPARARGHEVLHAVERGRAVAVRATYADGAPLAYTPYEVYGPADAAVPHQKGRTDRSGWLAFVPDAPGAWRVKVVDPTGHGLDVTVDAAAPAAGGEGARGAPGASAAFVLRPLLGLAVIGVVFALLFTRHRRRGA